MQITRKSNLTGKVHTMEIVVSDTQLRAHQNGMLIQQAMPHLTADEREFIMTGITAEEWEEAFGNEGAA